jgi:hypothetical protein
MATSLVPDNWRVFVGNQVIDSVTEQSNNAYYLFISQHVTNLDTVLPDALDDPQQVYVDVYHNMIAGKRFNSNDVSPMIRNIPYVAGVYYDMYDDGDPLLATKNYYAITNAGSFYHVWKVLDNNNQSNSTIPPNFSDIDVNDELYQTADGYRWKYMYSVDSTTVAKFGTSQYFPYVANTTVSSIAVDGSIDVIQVQVGGQGYNNYLRGTFSSGDIRVGGNTVIYGLNSNAIASTVNGFYTGCLIYITTGTGIGQFRQIVDYYSSSNGKFAVVNSEFTVTPTNSDQFEVYPNVIIQGDGQQASNAVARALVNAVGNSIYRIEMLSRGSKYQYIKANVVANNVVGVITPATVRAIYSPAGGHGYDQGIELRSKAMCFAMKLSNSESNTIPTTNQFQQYGILRDPVFANVKVTIANNNLNIFTVGETVAKVDLTLMAVGANTSGNTTVSLTGGFFDQQLIPGQYVFLWGQASTTEMQLIQVNSVINSSSFTIASNCTFTDANTYVYSAQLLGNAKVITHISNTTFFISNLSSQWINGDEIIGLTSGAYGLINTTSINDVAKGLNTFVGMHKYTGSYVSGLFVENEKIYEGPSLAASTANASIHSAISNGSTIVVYASNQVGIFNNQIIGANSGAVFTLGSSYSPDIQFGSGKVLYLENISAVTRNVSHSENFGVVFTF